MPHFSLAAFVIAVTATLAKCDALDNIHAGWRMVDRFAAFRFELSGDFHRAATQEALVDFADSTAAFGWVQQSPRTGHLVGEIRLGKSHEGAFLAWLQQPRAGGLQAEVARQADTKIRFHFSFFKVLPSTRLTCFPQSPHACSSEEAAELAALL